MLILTRRVGEMLRIGDEVTITVLAQKGYQVRVGIEAPPHIAVHREEVYQRILQEGGCTRCRGGQVTGGKCDRCGAVRVVRDVLPEEVPA